MSDISRFSPIRALDRDGIPVSGALASFFLSGTTTPQVVYSDQALTVEHPIPLAADATGTFPQVFSPLALKCIMTDSSGMVLPGYPLDPVPSTPTGSTAAQISFTPTGDIPETNVQAAIERVQENLVAPLLAGGIGVTGNAPILENIDATDTPSGAYRFTADSTGSFPTGIVASDRGTIRLWRENNAAAVMYLVKNNSSATYSRSMAASAWGPWSFVVSGTDIPTARGVIEAAPQARGTDVVGQWRGIQSTGGGALVLPSGGTWAYFWVAVDEPAGAGVVNAAAGVAVGGSTIASGFAGVIYRGFAWRVS